VPVFLRVPLYTSERKCVASLALNDLMATFPINIIKIFWVGSTLEALASTFINGLHDQVVGFSLARCAKNFELLIFRFVSFERGSVHCGILRIEKDQM
jgi:hypothetical protein